MNKFQKIACKIAKDDKKKECYKGMRFQEMNRSCYAFFRYKKRYTYQRALDFKKWSKTKKY